MKQSLQLKIGQSLTMTPQLQQAIRLLQLSSLELQVEIQETLDSNPLLEQEDHLSEQATADAEPNSDKEGITEITTAADSLNDDRSEQTIPEELDLDTGWDDIYDSAPTAIASQPSSSNGEDYRDLFENQAKSSDALYDHLL